MNQKMKQKPDICDLAKTQQFNDFIALKMVYLINDQIYPAIEKQLLTDDEIESLADLFYQCLTVDQQATREKLKGENTKANIGKFVQLKGCKNI